ncbi:MAG: type II/IV secretion system ATPase subunit [Candidatus Nezhaarchaeales archaeon]
MFNAMLRSLKLRLGKYLPQTRLEKASLQGLSGEISKESGFNVLYCSFNPSLLEDELKLVESYSLKDGLVSVSIATLNGVYKYLVSEPQLSFSELSYLRVLMETMKTVTKPDPGLLNNPEAYIDRCIKEAINHRGINLADDVRTKLTYYLRRDTVGYGPLDPFMSDTRIEDISLEGVGRPVRVIHRDYGDVGWLTSNLVFTAEKDVDDIVMRLAHMGGKHVSTAFPMTEVALTSNHRATVTLSREISPHGSSFTIRKFREEPLTICHLVKSGTLSPLMAAYLWLLLDYRCFIMVIGPMASGKTTLLNALSSFLNPSWKIVTIEDTPELNLPHQGWKPLVARHVYTLGEVRTEIKIFDLVKLSLRERADFLIVGEVRGREVHSLIQAAASGHGCACTFHGDSFESMVQRLTNPPLSVKESTLPLIQCLIILKRVLLHGKRYVRRIVEIGEILSAKEYGRIFSWNPKTDTFTPSNTEEVVKASSLLAKIRERYLIGNAEILSEINNRASFLEDLIKKGIINHVEVAKRVAELYSKGRLTAI